MKIKFSKNKNTNQQTSSSSIGFAGLLTILFVGLKLTGYITWSWWWVLSPLWIGAALLFAIILVALIAYLIYEVFTINSK